MCCNLYGSFDLYTPLLVLLQNSQDMSSDNTVLNLVGGGLCVRVMCVRMLCMCVKIL